METRSQDVMMEARTGIEPMYTVLQTAAYPLCHRAIRSYLPVIYNDFDKVNDLNLLCHTISKKSEISNAKVNAGNFRLFISDH